ncbi:MAG: triple tyrosine motif-containing protein, partial [Ignavibacteria bacterium]
GTNKGINKIIDGEVSILNYKGKKFNYAVFDILFSDETIYYASNSGILVENNNTTNMINVENGLIYNDTWSLLKDDIGNIYFGSNGKGISIYNPAEPIVSYNKDSGLPDEKVLSICDNNEGELIFGTRSGVIKYSDNRFQLYKSKKSLRSNIVEVVYKSTNGEVLLGTKEGLKKFRDSKFINFLNEPLLIKNEIYSIAETRSGILYIGTRFGVFSIDQEKVQQFKYFDEQGSVFILSIIAIDEDEIYFGSFDKGVFIYDGNEFRSLTTENGLSTNRINCLHKRMDGTILVGTQKGINIINDGEVKDIIDMNDGLNNNVIADVNEDNNGTLYVSTFNGLNILQPENDSFKVRHITTEDGLINNNSIINASFLDIDGNLWISTQEGITKYNPKADNVIKTPPRMYISGVEIFNEEYPINELRKNPALSYDQNYIKFRFTGINLSAPDKIVYEYRLSGVDREWIRTKENSVQYTNLDDGDYLFEVKARNEWGYWSEPATLDFTINPVWWQTWWFKTIFWLFVLALFGGLIRYFEKRKLQKKIDQLERERALEKERARISQDMHDDVGTSLSEIAISSELLKKKFKENGAEKHISDISDRAAKVIDNISQIIWAINPRNDPLENLVAYLRHFSADYMSKAGIKCNFDIPENIPELHMTAESRRNIFLVVKEALHNIVKHSSATEACFIISVDNGKMELTISDNGSGIDASQKSASGNGLVNMQKRIEDIGGTFIISSEMKSGTKITIDLKL